MDELTLLKAIPSTEESDFRELCGALGDDKPEKGDRKAWGQLFTLLRKLEKDGLVEISWTYGQVDTLQLTEAGAARVRASK